MRSLIPLTVAVVSGLAAASFASQAEAVPRLRKKFIQTGWDIPVTPAFYRSHLAEIEKTPFDGVVLGALGWDERGRKVNIRSAFSTEPWQQQWFQQAADDLKAARSEKLTDNFILIGANPGNVGWFDDAGWREIVNHWRIAAWLAREGGLKGVLFDPEPYQPPHSQFQWSAQAGWREHSFGSYVEKARQRGAEVIRAVAEVSPELVVFCYFMNSVNPQAAAAADPAGALVDAPYNLYPAFINGWLDAAPPRMVFVDGCESFGYHAACELDFLRAANLMRHTALNLVAPENRTKYRSQVQASFGVYLDAYINPPESPWHIPPNGLAPAARLEANLHHAMACADEYVWIYGEKHRWWETANPSVKAEGWEDVMPGISDALDSISHTQEFIARKIAAGNPPNLLNNPGFSTVAWGVPDDWGTWQDAESKGLFSHDPEVGAGQGPAGSARMSGVACGCFIQDLVANPGELFFVRARVRQQGGGSASIRIRWQSPERKWVHELLDVVLRPGPAEPGTDWRSLEGAVRVPEGAGRLALLLNAANQNGPQDVIWFDDVELLKIR